MSSKKFKKSNITTKETKENKPKFDWKILVARVIIIMLCIAVVVTLIPSVFF